MKITDMEAYPAAAADFYGDPTLARNWTPSPRRIPFSIHFTPPAPLPRLGTTASRLDAPPPPASMPPSV